MISDQLEITKSDLFNICNRKVFASGGLCVHSHTHEVVIQRKGCKRSIKLKPGDRLIIQPR